MAKIKKRDSGIKIHQEQEIVTLAHKVSSALAAYTKHIRTAAIALAAAIVVFAGYSAMRSLDEQKAAPLIAVAYEYYNPSGNTASDIGKALELFRDIQKKYPGTRSGAIAQYYIGNCLTDLGQLDEAIKAYNAFVNKYSGDTYLLGIVYQRMGYAFRALGKQDDARNAFERSEALTGPGVATVELARMYEAAGNISESQKKYKIVQDRLGGTSWGMEAMGKVQKIEAAPKPPENKAAK